MTSEAVCRLSIRAQLFYRCLMNKADDFGLYDARPVILMAELFALQSDNWDVEQVEECLQECAKELIDLYEVDDKPYFHIKNWKQQTRSEKSKWPGPHGAIVSKAKPFSLSGVHDHPGKPAQQELRKDPINIPTELDTSDFRAKWDEWYTFRRKHNWPKYKEPERQLNKLAEIGVAAAIQTLEHSMDKVYQGLFPEKFGGAKTNGRKPEPSANPEDTKVKLI